MSFDKSLKSNAALSRHRNVLTRAERIQTLREEARWTDGMGPYSLPKVAHRKAAIGGKSKKVKATEAGATDSPTPAAEKK